MTPSILFFRTAMRVIVLCFSLALNVTLGQAAATGAAPKTDPVAQQKGALIAHLNSALAWYHDVQGADGWVVQPSDEYYRNSQHDLANQVVASAFGYARAMVAVIGEQGPASPKAVAGNPRQERLATLAATNTERLAALRDQQAELAKEIKAATAQDRPSLVARSGLVQAEIDLNSARGDALDKTLSVVANASANANTESLEEQIAALERAAPAVFRPGADESAKKTQLPAPSVAVSAGLVNRAVALFSLLGYRRSMDSLASKTAALQESATGLSKPIADKLRQAIQAGDQAAQAAAQTRDAAELEQARDKIENIATQVQDLAAAFVPLQQETMALENARTNLAEWKKSIISQTNVILRVFFARAIGLAIALALLVAISEIWRRATFKYVRDARRRRQFLLIRRFATTILMVVIIVMGFVSNFSSIATFAGFITAGIAVALQTVILSVAAYFFLIGRYGVRVGDRVTVSGVTGDVIDIGLVRVFLMELAGTGVDLHPTGRVVVLANSALFSNSPVYKQLPGTDYAWHEIYVTMAADADASRAEELLLKAVNTVYGGYRPSIEKQHGALEQLLDYKTDLPVPSAQIRLTDAGLEVVVRYPAEIRKMSEIDQAVTKHVLAAIRDDEALKKTLASMPRIRAAVKS